MASMVPVHVWNENAAVTEKLLRIWRKDRSPCTRRNRAFTMANTEVFGTGATSPDPDAVQGDHFVMGYCTKALAGCFWITPNRRQL